MLLLLLLSWLLLFTALNTTFCSWGEQWRCGVVRLDRGGEGEGEEAPLPGLWNLKGAALCRGLMSRTWVSSSLHRAGHHGVDSPGDGNVDPGHGSAPAAHGCCWLSCTTLAMMVSTVLVMGMLTQDTGLRPLLMAAAGSCLLTADCWLLSAVC